MGLNVQKGNMYGFVTHTWNTVKGKCSHDCEYCYMKRWGSLKDVRFDEGELPVDLGEGNYIFVGSSNDMWSNDIPAEWIQATLSHCGQYDNQYLFQSKNPIRFERFSLPPKTKLCTTIETNRYYPEMGKAPDIYERVYEFIDMVTIEPIMDFDLDSMICILKTISPSQINIGADTGNNNLHEPSKEKTLDLITWIKAEGIEIVQKNNLGRLLS